jgi:hypothetical protein
MDQPAYAEKDRLNTGSDLPAHLVVPCLLRPGRVTRIDSLHRPLLYAL